MNICSLYKYKIFWISCASFLTLMSLITSVVYQTVFYDISPFVKFENSVFVLKKDDLVEITIDYSHWSSRHFFGVVHKQLVNVKTGVKTDLCDSIEEFNNISEELFNNSKKRRHFLLPASKFPDGEYVLQTTLFWKPLFSLREHSILLSTLPLIICEGDCSV